MAEMTVQFGDGSERTFESKKQMLKVIGKWLLNESEQPMTLRQLYYRFVAMDLIENKQSQYQYLGEAIKEARLSGFIPWGWIEDRTRSTDAGDYDAVDPRDRFEGNFEWFKQTPDRYHRPRWQGQRHYVEVWVEKEALAGVFAAVCDDLKVVSFPNRGYTSITMLKEAAERFKDKRREKVPPMGNRRQCSILYFGDFDPSGQDIERNIREKLNDTFYASVHVERMALTREQIDEYELPPQPAKRSDSRYDDFVAEHGNMAVELDALPPEDLRQLIRDSVDEYFDESHYREEVLPEQREGRQNLREWVDEVLAD